MIKKAIYGAALAAMIAGTFAPVAAVALDKKTYALYSAGKSSDDSWDRCDDDDDKKFGKSYRHDDDKKKCHSKKHGHHHGHHHGNNGWGNGGDDGNKGSGRGKTASTKTDFNVR